MDEADQSEYHKITGNEYYRLNVQSVMNLKSWYRTSNAFVGPVPRKETEHGDDLIHSLQNFDDIFLGYRTQ